MCGGLLIGTRTLHNLSDATSELISLKEEDEDHLVYPFTLVSGGGEG